MTTSIESTTIFEALVPAPTYLERQNGFWKPSFYLTIQTAEPNVAWLTPLIRDLENLHGHSVKVGAESVGASEFCIILDAEKHVTPPGTWEIRIGERAVCVTASRTEDLIRGVQRLRQLIRLQRALGLHNIPCATLRDCPRYSWRGMHLDCSRHFMPKSYLLTLLERLSLLGYNLFHWHLTDDQGWRIEIPGFPRLTEIGAFRKRTHAGPLSLDGKPTGFDALPHGGYYTVEDIREVVAFAAMRGITVMPEIEMPGHSIAAIAAYPEWSCLNSPLEVGEYWGIFPNLLCAGSDRTLHDLEIILHSVLSLFSSPYVHLGGDECPLGHWDNCPRCQDRIRCEGLKDSHELHAWFFRHFQSFLCSHGRTMVVWDDVLDEGELEENAIIMCWRGVDKMHQAISRGHRVVNCTVADTYFNQYQTDKPSDEILSYGGFLPLERVLQFDPQGGSSREDSVLGSQGHLWSEYMPGPADVDRMAFPRALGLAQTLWSSDASLSGQQVTREKCLAYPL